MTNIIDFPTPEDANSTPITPEFLMEFCEEFEIEYIEEFVTIFNQVIAEGLDDDDEEEDEYTVADPIPVELSTYLHNTIYPKLIVEFLEENNVRCDEDMEEFSQMINLLTAEPNVPLLVMN